MQGTEAEHGKEAPPRRPLHARPRPSLRDCNVVVTTRQGRRRDAQRSLVSLGDVRTSGYRSVLLMRAGDRERFLEALREHLENDPELAASLSRAVPAEVCFTFGTPTQLEEKLREVLIPWASRIAGQRFHVRFHRRGFKQQLSSHEEERRLADFLFESLAAQGQSASVDFTDPDCVVYVDTVGPWAGVSTWSREARRRYPFLRVD